MAKAATKGLDAEEMIDAGTRPADEDRGAKKMHLMVKGDSMSSQTHCIEAMTAALGALAQSDKIPDKVAPGRVKFALTGAKGHKRLYNVGHALGQDNSRAQGNMARGAQGNTLFAQKKIWNEDPTIKAGLTLIEDSLIKWTNDKDPLSEDVAKAGNSHISMQGFNTFVITVGVTALQDKVKFLKLASQESRQTADGFEVEVYNLASYFTLGWRAGSMKSAAFAACVSTDKELKRHDVAALFIGLDTETLVESGYVVENSKEHRIMRAHDAWMGVLNDRESTFGGVDFRESYTAVTQAASVEEGGTEEQRAKFKALKKQIRLRIHGLAYRNNMDDIQKACDEWHKTVETQSS